MRAVSSPAANACAQDRAADGGRLAGPDRPVVGIRADGGAGLPGQAHQGDRAVRPGGSADLIARVISAKLSESFGHPVIVENQAGAGGEIGIAAVARANPDGYTLLMTPSGSITAGPHFRKQSFDVTKDLAPVAMMAVIPTVFAVSSTLPVHTLSEFIAYARQRPGKDQLRESGPGVGQPPCRRNAPAHGRLQMVAVPYKGTSASTTALASGEVEAGSGDLTSFARSPSRARYASSPPTARTG